MGWAVELENHKAEQILGRDGFGKLFKQRGGNLGYLFLSSIGHFFQLFFQKFFHLLFLWQFELVLGDEQVVVLAAQELFRRYGQLCGCCPHFSAFNGFGRQVAGSCRGLCPSPFLLFRFNPHLHPPCSILLQFLLWLAGKI